MNNTEQCTDNNETFRKKSPHLKILVMTVLSALLSIISAITVFVNSTINTDYSDINIHVSANQYCHFYSIIIFLSFSVIFFNCCFRPHQKNKIRPLKKALIYFTATAAILTISAVIIFSFIYFADTDDVRHLKITFIVFTIAAILIIACIMFFTTLFESKKQKQTPIKNSLKAIYRLSNIVIVYFGIKIISYICVIIFYILRLNSTDISDTEIYSFSTSVNITVYFISMTLFIFFCESYCHNTFNRTFRKSPSFLYSNR